MKSTQLMTCLVIVLILIGIAFPAILGAWRSGREQAQASSAHNMALALFLYANDHSGQYPVGPTSTAICQQLYDARYLTDPRTALVQDALIPTAPHFVLPAQFVAWDVLQEKDHPLDGASPDELPLLFSTGLGSITFHDGVNTATVPINLQGTFGGTVAYMDQSSRFVKPDPGTTIEFTNAAFRTHGHLCFTVTP